MSKRADGEGAINSQGYVQYSRKGLLQYGHREIAERALGKPLPKLAQVHHVDENPSNNESSNLVICPSQSYHRLLHKRMKAYDACGNPDYRKCRYCGKYDSVEFLQKSGPRGFTHSECRKTHRTDQ